MHVEGTQGDRKSGEGGPTQGHYIREILRLSQDLLKLTEAAEANASDDGCRVLSGIVRDCAHKMRASARREQDAHEMTGIWED